MEVRVAADVAGGVMARRSPCSPWEWHDERGYHSRVWTRKCPSWRIRVARPVGSGNWHFVVCDNAGACVEGAARTQQAAKRLASMMGGSGTR